ncbi:MAG: hypothetical protein QOH95_94, partial [Gaiellaceae bacterium]|nr:hypothetical protein [Gaiellaceae bacterium]
MTKRLHSTVVLLAACAWTVWVWIAPAPAPRAITLAAQPVSDTRPVSVLTVPRSGDLLPLRTEHGLLMRLRQYPDLSLATSTQRSAARSLLTRLRSTALELQDPRSARAAGFDVRRPHRRHGDLRVMWFHSENRAWHSDRRYLDPRHPDTLIFADVPNRPLILVGVMISMPRGMRGPTPGGPITRWHSHRVCVRADRRGLAPRGDGTCPAGARFV